ncbi:hypothetical protein [Clostridium perfringens]|uniref:hypothetical protein n=1 Tax=Clostridium perfringens TaxID=1502 RepID=UPI001588924D|nr:hypothetical protein [Clostridium perfringens]
MVKLNQEIMEINNRMRTCKENSIAYNVLAEEVDRKYSEFLSIKHTLQTIKMPIMVV